MPMIFNFWNKRKDIDLAVLEFQNKRKLDLTILVTELKEIACNLQFWYSGIAGRNVEL